MAFDRSRGLAGLTLVEVIVALGITMLTVGAVVEGYIFCTTASAKDSLNMAATGRVMQRIEEVRSARWDTSSFPPVDQLVATNFPDKNISLELNGEGVETVPATVKTFITDISTTPPLRRVRVDCIWLFKGSEPVTNSIETCRAPDQ